MPLNKEAQIRYLTIDACLCDKRKPFPSMALLIAVIEEKIGKSFTVSTIQKDLKALKEDEALGYLAPIKFSKSKNGYYYSDPNYTLRSVPLNSAEIESLLAATDLLRTFSGDRVGHNFNTAVDKILASVREKFDTTSDKRVLIQTENPPRMRGWEYFELLFQAAKDKTVVSFIHYSYSKRVFNAIVLHPYLLKEFQNRWYIVGYSEKHRAIRNFGLDRVIEPLLINKKFNTQLNFNPESYYKDTFGLYPIGKKKEQIHFRVSPLMGNYLLSQPLHESQSVVNHYAYGHLLLQLDIIPSVELINQFVMLSNHITIIKPQWVRKEVQEQLKTSAINAKH